MPINKALQQQRIHQTKPLGFTLLEVLITLVILAIGLLGLAGLQATSLKQNQSAYQRGQAAQLSYDITDRVRSNMSAISTYQATTPSDATQHTNCTTSTGCSTTQMAQNDLYEWNKALTDTLPSGSATISLTSGVNIISITWDDDHDGDNTNNPTFVLTFKP